jgi:hypothetical protein
VLELEILDDAIGAQRKLWSQPPPGAAGTKICKLVGACARALRSWKGVNPTAADPAKPAFTTSRREIMGITLPRYGLCSFGNGCLKCSG